MATNRSPERRRKPPEPWRIERMVQRVPAHLDEDSSFSPWLVVGAVAVVALVGGLLLFFSGLPTSAVIAPTAEGGRTRTPRATTVIVVTATPPANATTPTRRPTPYVIKYVVKSGDTLIEIAQRFNVTVDQIRDVNNLSSDLIHVGDELFIPQPTPTPRAVAGGPSPTPSPTETATALAFNTPTLIALNLTPGTPTTPTPTPGVVLYYVQTGDTLGTIAKAYSTTVESLMSLNSMKNTSIRAGQPISVPVGASWIPTLTPTVYIQPTETLTPEYAYGAPMLLAPGQDATVKGTVNFQWTAVGVLSADEYYVLSLRYPDGDDEITRSFNAGQSTVYRLDTPSADNGATEFTWYVIAVRASGCGPASPAAVQPCAVSPPSERRTFTWQ